MEGFEVLTSVEVYHIATKALRRGGSLKQARAYFQIILVGSTYPRLLAVGGQNGTSTMDTSEWWEEEEDSWEEGPALSRGRSNFGALMAPPHLVCSEIDPPLHSCPADQNNSQTCIFPSVESGGFLQLLHLGIYILCRRLSPSLPERRRGVQLPNGRSLDQSHL